MFSIPILDIYLFNIIVSILIYLSLIVLIVFVVLEQVYDPLWPYLPESTYINCSLHMNFILPPQYLFLLLSVVYYLYEELFLYVVTNKSFNIKLVQVNITSNVLIYICLSNSPFMFYVQDIYDVLIIYTISIMILYLLSIFSSLSSTSTNIYIYIYL